MASRLGQYLVRAKFNVENFELFALYLCYFFICYLAALWPLFDCYWGNSLIHPMLIIAIGLSIFYLKVTTRDLVSTSNWLPSELWSQCHNTLSHAKLQKILFPELQSIFPKSGNAPNTQNIYSVTLSKILGLHNTSLDALFRVQNFSFCW